MDAHDGALLACVYLGIRDERADEGQPTTTLLGWRIVGRLPVSLIAHLDKDAVSSRFATDDDMPGSAGVLDGVRDGFVRRQHDRCAWRLTHPASLEPGVERTTQRTQRGEDGLDKGFETSHT